MNRFTGLVVGAVVAPTLAISGGLERSELPTSFLYEDGNYLEVTYINRKYEITDNMFAPSRSMWMMSLQCILPRNLMQGKIYQLV